MAASGSGREQFWLRAVVGLVAGTEALVRRCRSKYTMGRTNKRVTASGLQPGQQLIQAQLK